jgi:hypothetical protein
VANSPAHYRRFCDGSDSSSLRGHERMIFAGNSKTFK